MADLFKGELTQLETRTRAYCLDLSQRCWTVHASKRKSAYNECSLDATVLLHIFSDGHKRLKALKRELLRSCTSTDPEVARQCRDQVFVSLQPHLDSLKSKIEREQRYSDDLFASKHRPSNNVAPG